MYKKVSSDENFKILENLPGDLKDILFLPDTADHIGNVCEKFKGSSRKRGGTRKKYRQKCFR